MKLQPLDSTPSRESSRHGDPIDKTSQAEFELAMDHPPKRLPFETATDAPAHTLCDASKQALKLVDGQPPLIKGPEEKKTKTALPLVSSEQKQKTEDAVLPLPQPGGNPCARPNAQAGNLTPPETRLSKPLGIDNGAKARHALDGLRAGESVLEPAIALVKHSHSGSGSESSGEQREHHREHNERAHVVEATEEPTAVPLLLLQTPGDKLLSGLQSNIQSAPLSRDLHQLLDALQAHLQTGASHNKSAALLHVTLPNLGSVEIQLTHTLGQLQVDILANPGSVLQLQQARGDLMERLHKLDPEQHITLSFTDHQDSDQGSRQRRHIKEEWEPQA